MKQTVLDLEMWGLVDWKHKGLWKIYTLKFPTLSQLNKANILMYFCWPNSLSIIVLFADKIKHAYIKTSLNFKIVSKEYIGLKLLSINFWLKMLPFKSYKRIDLCSGLCRSFSDHWILLLKKKNTFIICHHSTVHSNEKVSM